MIDDLLGYLLEALESDDAEEIVRALQAEPELAAQLELLRCALEPLELCRPILVLAPPPDLAERTWVLVRQSMTVIGTPRPADPLL